LYSQPLTERPSSSLDRQYRYHEGEDNTGGIMVKDPVCGMMIDEKTAKGQSEYQGQTYYFCAVICKTKFDQDPAKYVRA
jgi:YHS domain-containing protein